MKTIEITGASLVGVFTAIGYIWVWVSAFAKIAKPLIKEAEKLAQDGLLDKDDRKRLVMMVIEGLEKDGKIKLNFFTRIILSFVVDHIAKSLPDFSITKDAQDLTKQKLLELKANGLVK